MVKEKYNEETTKLLLITPVILSKWPHRRIIMEYPVKILGKTYFADYVLLTDHGKPLAVVEAKANSLPAENGLKQARKYSDIIPTPFAFSTNGEEVIEVNNLTNTTNEYNWRKFPDSDELFDEYLSLMDGAGNLCISD